MKEINLLPTTPNNVMKKVEDQMRSFGGDTKLLNNLDQME